MEEACIFVRNVGYSQSTHDVTTLKTALDTLPAVRPSDLVLVFHSSCYPVNGRLGYDLVKTVHVVGLQTDGHSCAVDGHANRAASA
jgi:hypothetical protein